MQSENQILSEGIVAVPPPKRKRRRLSTEARRAELLAAGKRIFSERSYDAISTEEIATEAKVSTGLLYHYFGNKRGYYLATIATLAEELLAATEPRPGEAIHVYVNGALERFLEFVETNPALYGALQQGGIGSDGQALSIVENVRQSFVERVLSAVGRPVTDQIRNAIYGWVGMVETCAHDWIRNASFERSSLRDHLSRVLFSMLAGMFANPSGEISGD